MNVVLFIIKFIFLLNAEYPITVITLWKTIHAWLDTGFRKTIARNTAYSMIAPNPEFISPDGFPLCFFYNNLEFADLSVFRTEKYLSYFEYLDKAGGFYHERWGDAPVHSWYMIMMLDKTEIHRFANIFYTHGWFNIPVLHSIRERCNVSFDGDNIVNVNITLEPINKEVRFVMDDCTNLWVCYFLALCTTFLG